MKNDLFFKNGKAKKKYCMCMSPSYIAEVRSVNDMSIKLGCVQDYGAHITL